jgi:hypothetical protein
MNIRSIDGFYYVILSMVAAIALWLVSMPFCKFVQRTTINRFHLQTESFAVWAIQQPIPAMYNLYNRYEVRPSPWKPEPDASEPDNTGHSGTVNHFPLRMFTFGDNRKVFLPPEEIREIDIWSSYRGETLHTRWVATPSQDGGFDLMQKVHE